jgi:hypothetical protein
VQSATSSRTARVDQFHFTQTKEQTMAEKRGNSFSFDPITDVAIIGGLSLPPEERGDHDTEIDEDHPLHDTFEPLTEPFIANVDAYGVIENPVVWRDGGIVLTVAGRKRIRAARVVNRRRAARGEPGIRVTCSIEPRGSTEARLMGIMSSENEARVDKSYLSKMEKIRRQLERGVHIDDVAINFNMTTGKLQSWIDFEEHAVDEVRDAVHSGAMSISAGIEVTRGASHDEQLATLATLATETAVASDVGDAKPGKPSKKQITTRQARNAAKTAKGKTVGVPDTRTHRRLLQSMLDMNHPKNVSEKTMAFWAGAESILGLILGEKDHVDERHADMLKEIRKQMNATKK